MAEIMADEAACAAPPEKKKEALPRIKSGVTEKLEEYRASAGVDVQEGQICEACAEPASRLGTRRRVPATSEIMDVTAGETATELTERLDGFASVQDGLRQMSTNGALSAGKETPAARTPAIRGVTAGETAPVSDPVRVPDPVQVSAPVVERVAPCPAPPPARVPEEKIILTFVPSGMESAARQWINPASLAVTNPLPPESGDDEKVWCGGCDARVPTWFGRDCIAAQCKLRGLK